jgi:hypothetical protein
MLVAKQVNSKKLLYLRPGWFEHPTKLSWAAGFTN